MRWPLLLLVVFTSLLATAPPAEAQQSVGGEARAPVPRLVGGGVLGGAAGLLAGGLTGLLLTANRCSQPGDPDSCGGLVGTAVGLYVGHTLGAPIGVHLANRRDGRLTTSVLVSAGAAAVGALLIAASDGSASGDGGPSAPVVLGVATAVPIVQLVGSVILERRTARRR